MGIDTLDGYIARNLAIPAALQVARRPTVKIYRELKANESLSRDEMTHLQLTKLRRLVAHAYGNVPFYRTRFDAIRARPEDIRSFEDYARLPVLEKQDVIDNLSSLVATNYPRNRLVAASTGGSTGMPMPYIHDRRYTYGVSTAGIWRAWEWAGIEYGEKVCFLWGGPREAKHARSALWKLKHFVMRQMFIDAFDLGDENLRRALAAMQEYRPRLLHGYASSVAMLADYVREHGLELKSLKAVITTAEKLFPEQRTSISGAFGCRVHDAYGSREVRAIASECSRGCMHVNSDLNVVEFLAPSDGNANGPKELVVTPLELFGFPMLRYRNEDCGAVGDPCDCGLPFPTMAMRVGRISDNFRMPSGKVVHGEYFTHLMYGLEGIRQFQFLQLEPRKIVLKIVLDDKRGDEEILRKLEKSRREAEMYLGEGVEISLARVEAIPLTASGKHRFTISNVTTAR